MAIIHSPLSTSWHGLVLPLLIVMAFIGMGLLIFAFGPELARKDLEILLAYIEGRRLL